MHSSAFGQEGQEKSRDSNSNSEYRDQVHVCAGVRLQDGQNISADLVIDASGKTSRISSWLGKLGHPPTPTMTVDAGLKYATRVYEIPDDPDRDWSVAMCMDHPEGNRIAFMLTIEHNMWQVGCSDHICKAPSTAGVCCSFSSLQAIANSVS